MSAPACKRSFPPVIAADTRLLVCGSLPGDRSLAAGRYYAHPQNQFWALIGAVIDLDLSMLDYDARLATLLSRGVGLWDTVGTARRDGSTDAAIRDETVNDLGGLALTLRSLRAIAFNGATAFRLGARAFGAEPAWPIVALPSSSPLHTVGIDRKLPAWRSLRAYLA